MSPLGLLYRKFRTSARLYSQRGLRVFLQEAYERMLVPLVESLLPIRRTKRYLTPLSVGADTVYPVSVVIPTLNGGPGLVQLVSDLIAQRGCEVEVILVDSGSSDGSLSTLAAKQDKRLRIVPISGGFSHSGARNQGVSLAIHPRALLTVQDAQIPQPGWLQDFCRVQDAAKVLALSAREVPHHDADDFARYAVESHYHSITRFDGQTVSYHHWPLGRLEREQAASIGNVACLYQTSWLREHPFRGNFGEDFDQGRRVLRWGGAVGRTSEVVIQHSHNRPPIYWLKRMFASRRLLLGYGLTTAPELKDAREGKALVQAIPRVFAQLTGQPTPTARAVIAKEDPSLHDLLTFCDGQALPPALAAWAASLLEATLGEPETTGRSNQFLLRYVCFRVGWILGGRRYSVESGLDGLAGGV